MSHTVHAFDFLKPASKRDLPSVCVLFGDEWFLKRQVLIELLKHSLGENPEEVPYTTFEGPVAPWRDVMDELSTVSLFGGDGPRVAVVQEADEFVQKNRGELERYAARPSHVGRLILIVSTWAGNTKLYKQIDKSGLQVQCRAPDKGGRSKAIDTTRVKEWLVQWCARTHDATLRADAARALVDLVGCEFGLLDQELAKLALYAGLGGTIDSALVTDVVGGWRTKTIWELVDAAAEGRTAEALGQLDRLLHAGENPLALYGQIAWSLRRFAAATRHFENAEAQGRRMGLNEALERAGFPKWSRQAMEKAQRQLRHLGRRRAGQIYQWLLEADLALKGSHSAPHRARLVLEGLLVRMA